VATTKARKLFRNKLLNALLPDDLALLTRDLERVELPRRKQLEHPNRAFDSVYFIETGIASVVGKTGDTEVEVGVIGCEGVTGIPVLLGDDRSPNSTYMQVSGSGQRLAVAAMRSAIAKSETLRTSLLRYVQAFMTQTAATAIANARATLEERLARWLLMAHDRIDGDSLDLTHEFLALMMGTRRAGVTESVHLLAQAGFIRPERGLITIVDRNGLRERAGKFYGGPEAELKRLVG
jgi:CRP-like cAMP-binding protein